MSTYLHRETHFESSDLLRDIVIGMADGLTVPFALAAGISGAVAGSGVVVTAGVAEIVAGSIAMGLGGYLAAQGDVEHYASELVREEQEILEKPQAEVEEIAEGFRQYGLTERHNGGVIEGLRANPLAWRDFMMRFELGLQKPDPKRAGRSALLYSGRAGPVGALHGDRLGGAGTAVVDRGYAGRAGRVRIRQGPVHRRRTPEVGAADGQHRRICGRRRVRAGARDQLNG